METVSNLGICLFSKIILLRITLNNSAFSSLCEEWSESYRWAVDGLAGWFFSDWIHKINGLGISIQGIQMTATTKNKSWIWSWLPPT